MTEEQDGTERNKTSSSQLNEGSSDVLPLCKVDTDGQLKVTDLKVEPLIFMLFFGFSLSGPILTNLLLVRSCEALNYSVENCTHLDSTSGSALEEKVQPYVARLYMYKSYVETPLPALMSLFLGAWSDKHGRRPIILIALTGIFLQNLLLIVFSLLNISPFYVLLTSFPVIFTGGTVLLLSAIFSYISDCSKGKYRTYRLALAEAFIYLGILLGTLVIPFIYPLFPSYGFAGMISLSCACSLISLLYAAFFVTESVLVQPRNAPILRSLVDWSHITDVFQTCFYRQIGVKRTIFLLLLLSSTLNLIVIEGLPSVLYLFTRNKFAWTLRDFTIYGDVALLMLICGIALGTTVSTKWSTETSDGFVACFAFMAKMIAFIIAGISPVSWFLYLSSAVSALGGVAAPVCRSILCKCVQSTDIGKAFVLLSFMNSLVPMVASTVYSSLYSYTLDTFPGAFYIMSAAIAAVCCLIMGWISYLLHISSSPAYSTLHEHRTTASESEVA